MVSPLVTIVTAAYNSSRTLRVALQSLRNQTFTDWEAWIVGDACTDDSGDVVRSFGDDRLHWVNLERNYGSQWFPNNEGLRRAKGKYVAYLGHDDLWLPDHLKDLVQLIEESGADFVHSICGLFGPQGWLKCKGLPKQCQSYEDHFIPPSSWLHRRDLVESVGYWADPAALDVPIDFEYSRRVHRAGKKIAFYPRFSVVKIPSHMIRLYAMQGAPPQEALWERIRTDLPGFEHELLGAVASEVARLQWGRPLDSLWVAIRRVLRILKRGMLRPLQDHPLTFRYRHARFQQDRTASQIARGLPPAGPSQK